MRGPGTQGISKPVISLFHQKTQFQLFIQCYTCPHIYINYMEKSEIVYFPCVGYISSRIGWSHNKDAFLSSRIWYTFKEGL